MSNLHLFVAGSIHQGSDISRGRHCSFRSFSALFAQTLPIQQWPAPNVDQILADGDRLLYLDAFESRSIPDTETLSLDYLSREMRWPLDANTMQIYTRQTRFASIPSLATIIKGWTVVDKTLSILMTKYNVFTEKLQCLWSCNQLGAG
jgi:hypothetical protein